MKASPLKNLLETIHSDPLDNDLFNNTFEHPNDRKEVMQSSEEKVMFENIF